MAMAAAGGALHAATPDVDFHEIRLEEKVGHGSYGVVYKAVWRQQLVAVKEFGASAEQKAIETEVKQLSRVKHDNIIALHGISSYQQATYLIMEYAEGGSLHNFLHGKVQPAYSLAHAMSWARQCAEGVAYLHAMTPKPLIHRDLKPLNLLLTNKGRHLKICDFGTVADKSTMMTNNRGSAAWMAPEVFEGSKYTEKCDIFSWAIVLWEVLSRKQPFKDIDNTYSIMWKIHKGERPPLLHNCPKLIEDLMTDCWKTAPEERPPMKYVVSVMNEIIKDYAGAEKPLEYTFVNQQIVTKESDGTVDAAAHYDVFDSAHTNSLSATPTNVNTTTTTKSSSTTNTSNSSTSTPTGAGNVDNNAVFQTPHPQPQQALIVGTNRWDAIPEEEDSECINESFNLTSSAEATKRLETIRNGMIQMACTPMAELTLDVEANGFESNRSSDSGGSNMQAKSDGKERLTVTDTKPVAMTTTTTTTTTQHGADLTNNNTNGRTDIDDEDDGCADEDENVRRARLDEDENDGTDQSLAEMLDPDLQPEPPIPNNPESQSIYRDHRNMAKEYLRVDTNLYYAQDFKEKLILQMDRTEREQKQELLRKIKDREGLFSLYSNLQQQWEKLLPIPAASSQELINNSSQSNSLTSGEVVADDGWVVIPPHHNNT